MKKKAYLALLPALLLAACTPNNSSIEVPSISSQSENSTTSENSESSDNKTSEDKTSEEQSSEDKTSEEQSSEDKTSSESSESSSEEDKPTSSETSSEESSSEPSSSEQDSSSETNPSDVQVLNIDDTNIPTKYGSNEKTIRSDKGDDVEIMFKDVANYSNNIQFKKTSGRIYNITPLKKLSNLQFKIAKNGVRIAFGSSQNPEQDYVVYNDMEQIISVNVPEGCEYFSISGDNGSSNLDFLKITYNGVGENPNPTPTPDPDIPGPDDSSSEPSNPDVDPSVPVDPGAYDRPTSALTGYYSSFDINANGAKLLSQARELTVSTHKRYTNYDECVGKGASGSGKAHLSDPHPDHPGKLLDFYTHAPLDDYADYSSNYNREHVWPKSLSSKNWGTTGGGSDLHHIRPTYSRVNSIRGNKQYGECSHSKVVTHNGLTAGYTSGNTYEPMDNVKGDVARIILYTFIHYNSPSNLEACDNLTGSITSTASSKTSGGRMAITQVMAGGSPKACFDLLIKWHNLDKVDSTEITRNNAVYSIQGNRNPFIDQPWIVNAIWG